LFTNHKRLGGYKWKQGVLCVYKFTIKSRSYKLCGVLDVGLGSLLRLHDGPCTTGSGEIWGVSAPKTCQHMLRHCLHQGTTLCLELAINDLLQLQHLGPNRVKQRERNIDLFHHILGAEGTEAEKHQRGFDLA
jgi:hypothetical protein